MELLPILSILWRRRWLVVIGFVAALAAAYFLQSKPTLGVGTAAAQVMLDTPRSDLASSEFDDTTNLATRAALVAHSMLTEDVRDRLARSLGVKSDRVAIVDTSYRNPTIQTTLPLAASEAAMAAPEPYLLQTRFDGQTAIISLEARGPDPASAARLADAAVDEITTHVPTGDGPEYKPFTIERIMDTRVRQLAFAQGRMMAVVAAGTLFGIWCVCLVLGTRLAGWFRGRVAKPEPSAQPT
jgi:hypothetical protein